MYSKDEIVEELKRVSAKLNKKNLTETEFEQNSTVPMHTLNFYMGNWSRALIEAGLVEAPIPKGQIPENADQLLRELLRIYDETGEIPTAALVTARGKYAYRHYAARWKSLNEAFALAKSKFTHESSETVPIDTADTLSTPTPIPPITATPPPPISPSTTDEDIESAKTFREKPFDFSDLGIETDLENVEEDEMHEDEITVDTSEHSIEDITTGLKSESDKNEVLEMDIHENEEVLPSPNDFNSADISTTGKSEINTRLLPKEASEATADAIPIAISPKGGHVMTGTQKIKLIPKTIKPKTPKKKRKILGEAIDFRGLKYAPVNEMGVAYLFGMISHELGFEIESISTESPVCEGKRCLDAARNQWESAKIDFLFKSSDFEKHELNEDDCDIIICWIHDWPDCPLEILELRSILQLLEEND